MEKFKIATKEIFDRLIKQKFLDGAPILPGVFAEKKEFYGRNITTRGKTDYYDTYFSKSFGNEVLEKIDENIKKRYKDGKGGEFESKFFSVASSSRLAVASFSNKVSDRIVYIQKYLDEEIKEILFEKDLRIKDISGTPPQMDVWIKTSHDIFFEVKCHEIFDEYEHANIKLSTQYRKNRVFNEIVEKYAIDLTTRERTYIKDGNIKSYYLLNRNMFHVNTKTSRFDLKQFICHLMGIVSYKEKTGAEVEFNYLFYKNVDKQFDQVYVELENELSVIKKSFEWFFTNHNIKFSWFYNDKFSTLEGHSKRGH